MTPVMINNNLYNLNNVCFVEFLDDDKTTTLYFDKLVSVISSDTKDGYLAAKSTIVEAMKEK